MPGIDKARKPRWSDLSFSPDWSVAQKTRMAMKAKPPVPSDIAHGRLANVKNASAPASKPFFRVATPYR